VLFGLLGLRIPEPELRKLEFMVVLLISDCRYCCWICCCIMLCCWMVWCSCSYYFLCPCLRENRFF
jgi:hypothetical protein